MDHPEQLSTAELQELLEQIDVEKQELMRALDARHEDDKRVLADDIKAIIKERGQDVEEIAKLLVARKRRSPKRSAANAGYTRYADPENLDNIYIRGRLPNWLAAKMTATGYDPGSKEHRDLFKEEQLIKIAA